MILLWILVLIIVYIKMIDPGEKSCRFYLSDYLRTFSLPGLKSH